MNEDKWRLLGQILMISLLVFICRETLGNTHYKRLINKQESIGYFNTISKEVKQQDKDELAAWRIIYRRDHQMHIVVYQAVTLAESDMNPNAISNKGCLGLMQLEPTTAKDMGFNGENINLLNPGTNILYGTRYLRWVYKYYRGHKNRLYKTLDAYNRGIGNVDKYPYKGKYEEQRYVKRVLAAMKALQKEGY